MREILFRGKRVDNGEWVKGHLFDDDSVPPNRYFIDGITIEDYKGTADDDYAIIGADFHEIDIETVGQYTGFSGCNGTKIFEGDIIAFEDYTSTENGYWEQECIGEVYWDEETASFQVTNRLSCESYEAMDGECKVIGNIFDNPELMEV